MSINHTSELWTEADHAASEPDFYGKWSPIASAPLDKSILLWWVPNDGNKYSEVCVIGQVSTYEPGKWWSSHTGAYQDICHVTHWMSVPESPIKVDTM